MEWGQEVGSSETVMKIVMLTIVVSLAAGCAPLHPSGRHKTTALGNCGSGRWEDQDAWGASAGNQGGDQCQT
jgi:colicin import membrane protein